MKEESLKRKIKEMEEFIDKARLEDVEYIRSVLETYKEFSKELQGKKQMAIPIPLEEDEVLTYAFGGLEKLHPSV